MNRYSFPLGLAFALLFATAGFFASAHADEGDRDSDPTGIHWSYLYDGGALPFVLGSGAVYLGLQLWVDPRDTPLFFSADEGGAEQLGDTFPNWVLGANGAAALLGIVLVPDRARWFHVKGFVEAWFTTGAITQTTKAAFSRHRPDFDLMGDNSDGERKSFFSGHASSTLSQTTYLALYLRYHGFNGLRRSRSLPWWEALSYGGLAAVSFYIPYSRVDDNRHHVSDVIVGSAVGAATATAFFFWQEHRYRAAESWSRRGTSGPRTMLLPDVENRGVQLLMTW